MKLTDRQVCHAPDDVARGKQMNRAELAALTPDDAQAAAEQSLFPRLWQVEDAGQLAWPGDLADDLEGD